ncbi:hypothetical protein [Nocardia abscessus]|uniref:hypothetical protein n=1 Tax=Nocardia abscessus TaxID=120957 RepID=UPI0024586AD7|nr:hypothetical protein [Nocardia abscessus]
MTESPRATVERKSDAPRYVSTRAFASVVGVPPADLSRWRRRGPVWVPGPDVTLGTTARPGWDAEIPKDWTRDARPYARPDPVSYWDLTEMQRRHGGMRGEEIWLCLMDGTLRWPDIWVDERPGWLPR